MTDSADREGVVTRTPIAAVCVHEDGFEHPSSGRLPCSWTLSRLDAIRERDEARAELADAKDAYVAAQEEEERLTAACVQSEAVIRRVEETVNTLMRLSGAAQRDHVIGHPNTAAYSDAYENAIRLVRAALEERP